MQQLIFRCEWKTSDDEEPLPAERQHRLRGERWGAAAVFACIGATRMGWRMSGTPCVSHAHMLDLTMAMRFVQFNVSTAVPLAASPRQSPLHFIGDLLPFLSASRTPDPTSDNLIPSFNHFCPISISFMCFPLYKFMAEYPFSNTCS
jgi:hypothetical protein